MTAFNDLNRGDKIHLHISIYARYHDILDGICEQFNCSRADAVEALLKDYAAGLRPDAVFDSTPGRRRARKEPA